MNCARFFLLFVATTLADVVVFSSQHKVRGNFGLLNNSCHPITPWLATTWVNNSGSVRLVNGSVVAPNWIDFIGRGVWSHLTAAQAIWFGDKFNCGNWSSTTQCGGGQTTFPNGMRLIAPCSSQHHLLCVGQYTPLTPPPTHLPTVAPTLLPTVYPSKSPSRVPTVFQITSFSLGIHSTCVLLSNNEVYCHGSTQNGAFYVAGDGETVEDPRYVFIPPSAKLFGGASLYISQLLDGTWIYWGAFSPDLTEPITPFEPKALPDTASAIVDVAISPNALTVLLDTGDVYSIGDNVNGLWFGNNISAPGVNVSAFQEAMVGPARSVHGGLSGVCALLLDDTVWCWGSGDYGERGDGSMGGASVLPTKVLNLTSRVISMCGSGLHRCALLDAGIIKCWGSNFQGEGGWVSPNSSSIAKHAYLFDPYVNKTVDLICGMGLTCLRLLNGSHVCSGNIEYSDENSLPQLTPGVFGRLEGLFDVHKGGINSACGFNSTRHMICLGSNTFGNLGRAVNGRSVYRPTMLPAVHSVCVTQTNLICALFRDTGRIACIDDTNVNGLMHSNVAPAAIRIFCLEDYVYLQLTDRTFVKYSPALDALVGDYITFIVDIKDVQHYQYGGELFFGVNGQWYSKFKSILPSFASLDHACFRGALFAKVGQTQFLRLNIGSTFYTLDRRIKKLACGNVNVAAWIYEDGEIEMVPTNPFTQSTDVADVAFSNDMVCALFINQRGVTCYRFNDGWVKLPSLPDPYYGRLSGGTSFMCAEGTQGEAWCFHDRLEVGPFVGGELRPLRMNFTQV